MKYSNTIEYNINTKLDSSGLTKLQAQIKQLENSMQQMSNRELLNSDKVQAAKTQLEGLNTALTNSFNSSLGILDLSKFRAELDSSGVSAKGLQSAFNMMGAEGQSALNGLTTQIANFNGGMERTSSQIDKIFTTFSNTFRWGLVSSFFSQFMNAIHSSVDYVKELDDSLTQIMLVTDYNRDSMNEFARSANEAAKAVSMTTTGMTNASLIFAQQGYDLGQSQELATLSAKLANASQQDTATTSDQITAYMNAYGLQDSMEELTQQMDNWALIANVSAADVGELAKASQRAASMANAVGVSGEALAAQIATIESVTREAPEQIGNGLKTIYARFSDIALGKTDEDGVGLGKVTGTLEKIGVKVLDQFGDIRSMDDIMEDLMVVWDDLDTTTKTAAAQALAGKYQVNRFEALMENSDMYREYKGATGSAATGTLDQMNEEYANSIAGRSAKIQASLEGLFSTIFNTDDIYPWMDAAQGALDLLQKFFDALGGGKTVLLGISSLLAKTFNQNIARSINDTLANRELMQIRQQNIEGVNDTLDRAGIDRTSGIGQYISATAEQAGKGAINDAQYDTYMANVQNWINAQTALTQSEEELQDTINALNMAYGKAVGENNAVFKDENGLNTQFANEERLNLSQDQINKIMSQADFSEAIAGARNFSNELQQVQSIQEKYNNSSENAKQQLEQLYLASDRADAALEQLYNTGVISDDMFNDMKAAIAKVVVDLEESGQATDQTERELNELIATMGRFVKMAEGMDANQLKKTLLGGAEEVQKKQTARDFNQAQVNRADENAQKSRQNVSDSQNIKEILDTFNAVQQLTFAWQAFQNLGSLWANEDLTDGEKVLQTIMNLTMAMPQLISAMQTLQDNSFLKNMGNGLLNVLNSSNNVPTLFAQLQSQSDQIATIQNQAVEAQAAMGAPLEEALLQVKLGSDEIMELQKTADIGAQALQTLDDAASGVVDGGLVKLVEEGQKAQKQLDELENTVGKALEEGLIEAPKVLDNSAQALNKVGKESEKTQAQLSQMPNVFVEMYAASLAAGGGMAGFKAALDVAKTSMLEFLSVSGPFLAIGLAIAGIAYAIGQAQEQAKKAHEQAIAEFEDAKNAQQEAEEFSTKIDDWKSKRQENGDSKELAQEADKLADSLREAGNAAEANALHLAALKAEASGAASDFNALEEAATKAQQAMSDQSALDAMNAANAILKDRLSTEEEIAAAQETLQNAALDYNLSQASHTNGMEMGVLNTPGDNDLHAATMDWQSLNSILEQSVPGFKDITDENERLALALSHTSDEAQRAAIEIQQILNANDALSSSRTVDYGAGDIGNFNEREDIVKQLEGTGLSAEESLQLLVTVDDSSYETMTQDIQTVMEHINNGEPFEIAIQAIMDEQETEDYIKSQLAAYEPKDEDVESEDFQSLSNMFMDNADKMGEEGSPFEDYSEDLLNNASALEEVVEGILRYDDAVQTLDKNLEDWRDALNDTNEFSKEHIDAVQDLQETYSDFLDLSEDMDVSEEFAANAENLELMEDAANGVEGAYEKLADAAAEDILIHMDGIEDIDAAKAALTDLTSELPSLFEGVDIGGALDLSSVEDQINALADATGWSADQMAAYLNSIGINIDPNMFEPANTALDNVTATAETMANNVQGLVGSAANAITQGLSFSADTEMTEQTATKNDQIMYTNLIPSEGEGVDINGEMPSITPATIATTAGEFPSVSYHAHIPGVQYTPEPVTESQVKEMTGYGIKSEVTNGPGGTGGVKLKEGSSATRGSRGPSGGGKTTHGSRPSSPSGGSCFVAGTLVTTLTGFSPIEQIKQGDVVLSYNELFHQLEYSIVVQTMIHDVVEPIYTLHVKDEQLRVTGIHRFLISHDIFHSTPQWIPAANLQIGDWMFLADGTWHLIHDIEVNVEHQIVYNFEVAGNHNYYVGRNQILAHNKGGKSCFVAGTVISTSLGFKPIEIIKVDDIVLSYNESLRQNEYSKVVQTMIHNTIEPIYTLYIKNERLRVTGIHRFLISKDINFEAQWVAAQDLQIGDWVLLADGTWHLIWKIEVDIEKQTVYNFEVSGNHNYYVGHDQILAHNKGGGGKGGKGGKGGGGKAKTAEKKEKDKTEKKYYEEVSKQLDHVDETLDKVEETADKLIGSKARAKQNEQLKLLQKELILQQKKLHILQTQEKVDVSKAIKKADEDLESLLNKEGSKLKITNFEYDDEGFIKNLDEVRESITNGKNALIDKYNEIAGKSSLTESDEEELKRIDKQIKKYDDLAKKLEKNGTRYNEIVLEEEKIQNEMEEIKDSMQDIAIEALKDSQEALDNIKEMRQEWAEFNAGFYDESKGEKFLGIDNPRRKLKEISEGLKATYEMSGNEARDFYQNLIDENQRLLDEATKRYQAAKTKEEKESIKTEIETYQMAVNFNTARQNEIEPGDIRSVNNGVLQMALNDMNMLQSILDNWKENSRDNPIFGDNKAALMEALKEAEKLVTKYKEEWEESIEDLKDAALDVMDDVMDQWDRHLDRFDRVNDQLERYMDSYSLIYGDEAYNMQEKLLQQQGQTLQSQLEAAKNAYNQANQAYLDAAKEYIDIATGLPKEGYKEFMEHLEEARDEAEDNMRDIAAEAAEKFVDAFEASVKKSTQDILSATIGEKNFDRLDRDWEWDREYIDKYKDGVEKAYEMDKLRNKYVDMLNNAQGMSLQTQNKIRAQMQEQLALLDGQKTVSEYDVKLANAKLEILQKQIALEDAQRNKNKMRLRRDTQGNYRYVYTADQGDVQEAQQELIDSEYDAYEMSKQQQMSNYDDMLNAYKRYLSQREEILTNNNLSEAEKIKQIQELWDRFQKYVNAAKEDFADATAGTLDILNWLAINGTDYTATSAKTMLQDLLDEEGRIRSESNALWLTTAEDMANNVIPKIPEAVSKADDEIERKLDATHDILVGDDGTGGLFADVSNGANDFGDQVSQASTKVDLLVTSTQNLKDALLGDSVAFENNIAQIQQYQKELENASNSQSVLARSLEDTRKDLETSEGLRRNYETQINGLINGTYVIHDGKIVDKAVLEAQRRQAEEAKKTKESSNWSPYSDAYAIWMHGAWGGGGYWYGPYLAAGHTRAQANAVLDLFNRGYGYSWMDTGGYTGEWGSNEGMSNAKNGKLAVLHQKELVLNANDTKNILAAVSMVRNFAMSAQNAMSSIKAASSNNISTIYNPTTEQRVEIQANFPNATDAEDIRQALIGLSDKAYQYAHRVI